MESAQNLANPTLPPVDNANPNMGLLTSIAPARLLSIDLAVSAVLEWMQVRTFEV